MIISAVVGCSAIAAPVGAWIGSKLTSEKYKVEVDGLRAEVRKQVAEACSKELDNAQKANEMLMDTAAQLKKEVDNLRRDVNKLRKAVEKIPSCPYSDNCPVSKQLQCGETDSRETDHTAK